MWKTRRAIDRPERRAMLKSAALVACGFSGAGRMARAAGAPQQAAAIATPSNAVVEIDSGKVRGYTERGVYAFKGIPYGATTDGKNRWRPAQPAARWPGVRSSTSYGPVCPQTHGDFGSDHLRFLFRRAYAEPAEDCLRVNVWTPAINDNGRRPVLLWLHAMGFHSGSGHQFTFYDGANLARRGNAVVVSINHRLNVFGFLNLAQFGEPYADSANIGMLDIIAALTWVRENIGGFGGNAGNVTVFGQSGGGYKLCHLLAMPAARGLIHKAIVQSGASLRAGTQEDSLKLTAGVMQELGLTAADVSGLQNASVDRLLGARLAAQQKLRIYTDPVVDGRVLPNSPFEPATSAVCGDVPLLIGTTLHEEGVNDVSTEDALGEALRKLYPADADRIHEILKHAYPDSHPAERLAITRQTYRRRSLDAAGRKVLLGNAPVFSYIFAWQTPVFPERPCRAVHFMDVPFVFHNTDLCPEATGGTAGARSLAARMSDAWIQFAKTGNPGHAALPRWPAFTAERDATMFFDDACAVRFDHDRELMAAFGERPA